MAFGKAGFRGSQALVLDAAWRLVSGFRLSGRKGQSPFPLTTELCHQLVQICQNSPVALCVFESVLSGFQHIQERESLIPRSPPSPFTPCASLLGLPYRAPQTGRLPLENLTTLEARQVTPVRRRCQSNLASSGALLMGLWAAALFLCPPVVLSPVFFLLFPSYKDTSYL